MSRSIVSAPIDNLVGPIKTATPVMGITQAAAPVAPAAPTKTPSVFTPRPMHFMAFAVIGLMVVAVKSMK